jgi:hypothetical protein
MVFDWECLDPPCVRPPVLLTHCGQFLQSGSPANHIHFVLHLVYHIVLPSMGIQMIQIPAGVRNTRRHVCIGLYPKTRQCFEWRIAVLQIAEIQASDEIP